MGFFLILKFPLKTPLLQTSKNRPNYHHYRPQKIEKIAEKKVVRNFLKKIKFDIFFEFFTENVLKTLLGGKETFRKKYRIVFEKFFKYVIFFDFACPSITHPSPITTTHPSIYVFFTFCFFFFLRFPFFFFFFSFSFLFFFLFFHISSLLF